MQSSTFIQRSIKNTMNCKATLNCFYGSQEQSGPGKGARLSELIGENKRWSGLASAPKIDAAEYTVCLACPLAMFWYQPARTKKMSQNCNHTLFAINVSNETSIVLD